MQGYPPPYPPPQPPPGPFAPPHGQPPMGAPYGAPAVDGSDGGTQVLIWGVLGLALCAFCAPVAWIKGNGYMKSCQAMGVRPSSAGTVGRILGIVGTVLLGFGLLGGCLSVVAQAAAH